MPTNNKQEGTIHVGKMLVLIFIIVGLIGIIGITNNYLREIEAGKKEYTIIPIPPEYQREIEEDRKRLAEQPVITPDVDRSQNFTNDVTDVKISSQKNRFTDNTLKFSIEYDPTKEKIITCSDVNLDERILYQIVPTQGNPRCHVIYKSIQSEKVNSTNVDTFSELVASRERFKETASWDIEIINEGVVNRSGVKGNRLIVNSNGGPGPNIEDRTYFEFNGQFFTIDTSLMNDTYNFKFIK